MVRAGFDAVQPFYLEFPDLNQACTDGLLNLLMLNYDQFLELDAVEGSKIKSIDRQIVKEATQSTAFEGTEFISDDMKMYAIDIIFKKK